MDDQHSLERTYILTFEKYERQCAAKSANPLSPSGINTEKDLFKEFVCMFSLHSIPDKLLLSIHSSFLRQNIIQLRADTSKEFTNNVIAQSTDPQ
jgi:hypothetical protein